LFAALRRPALANPLIDKRTLAVVRFLLAREPLRESAGEGAMTKTRVYAVGVLGLLCASAAANAGLTFTDIYVQQNYYQTGGTTFVDLMSSPLAALSASLGANGPGGNAKIDFSVGVNAPADFTSITVSGPGFGSPQALNAPALDEHGEYVADYIDFGFSNLAALNAKYPLGSTYTFTATASNPALSQTATKTYDANHQPTSSPGGPVVVPLLTAASYASLQGLDVALADTLAFNAPIFGDGRTFLELAIFDLATLDAFYQSGQKPATTTSLLLPANTLASNTHYTFALGYSSSVNNVEFENFTFGEFTTAPRSVPEPPAPTLVAVALAGLALAARRKRERASR
jgi:hypothetical protein